MNTVVDYTIKEVLKKIGFILLLLQMKFKQLSECPGHIISLQKQKKKNDIF